MNALLTLTLILSFWVTIPVPQSAQRTNDLMDMLHGQHEPYAEFFGQIKDAFASNDPERIASLIEYPFRRYRQGEVLDIIESSDEFVRKFAEIVTPRVFEAVAAQEYEKLFVNYKGVMFGHGAVWYSGIYGEDCKTDCDLLRVRVIAINGG